MDTMAKLVLLRADVMSKDNGLMTICNSVGMCDRHSGASLHYAIRHYVDAMVELRVYEIITGPEFFGLAIHGASNYVEKQNGDTNKTSEG